MSDEITKVTLWSPAEDLWSVEVQYEDGDNLEADFATRGAAALFVQHVTSIRHLADSQNHGGGSGESCRSGGDPRNLP